MLIPITFNPPPAQNQTQKLPSALAKISHDEVILIELQGALEVEVAQPTDKNGKFVGKLTIDENGSGKATLLIGHHLLEGKIAPLTKPLAILSRLTTDSIPAATKNPFHSSPENSEDRKNCGEEGKDADAMECDDGDGNKQPFASRAQWEAVGIVKRKILFAKRPMPIVGRGS